MPEIVGRLRPPRLAAAPSSPAGGEEYYDTGLKQLLYWNGTAWGAVPSLAWNNLAPYYNTAYWHDYSGGPPWSPVQFSKDIQGIVRFQGLVQSVAAYAFGNPATCLIATLPVGYRPIVNQTFPLHHVDTADNNCLMRVDFQASGQVLISPSPGSIVGANTGQCNYMALSPLWGATV